MALTGARKPSIDASNPITHCMIYPNFQPIIQSSNHQIIQPSTPPAVRSPDPNQLGRVALPPMHALQHVHHGTARATVARAQLLTTDGVWALEEEGILAAVDCDEQWLMVVDNSHWLTHMRFMMVMDDRWMMAYGVLMAWSMVVAGRGQQAVDDDSIFIIEHFDAQLSLSNVKLPWPP